MKRSIMAAIAILTIVPVLTGCSCKKGQSHMEMALLWQQRAAEAKALFHQGYNVARMELDRQLKTAAGTKLAVIVDIDETVLDNSPYQVQRLKAGKGFDLKSWDAWCDKGSAKPLPGAKAFLSYASSKGVAVFYISNRREKTRKGTLANLIKEGFPQATNDRLLLRTTTGSKTARRAVVSGKYRIALLCGDNLGDFSEIFHSKKMINRDQAVQKMQKQFGRRFIVFPNPIYGAWEGAVYKGNWKASSNEKREMRYKAMREQ